MKKIIIGIGLGFITLFLLVGCGLSAEEKEFKSSCEDSGGTFIKCSGNEGGGWGAPWSGDSCEPTGKLKCFCPPMKGLVNDGDFCVKEFVKSELTPETCEEAGSHWNVCGNKCEIEKQGMEIYLMCPNVCDAICECETIKGMGCPIGFKCRTGAIADAMGYCGT